MLISSHLNKIVELISNNAVVSVVASTGSGKSVGIPAAIAAAGARCFVVVPTRTAAFSLTEYQRNLQRNVNQKIDVNKLIGYGAEGIVTYGSSTKIAYVTGGHMRRKLLDYFHDGKIDPIDFCDVIMADEAHSGSLDTSVIISLWMVAAASGKRIPRLVVASATPVPLNIRPAPVSYNVEFAAFPIEYKYLDKDLDINESANLLYQETANLAMKIHKTTNIDTGHILVFAPGTTEVERITHMLYKLAGDDRKTIIIPAFSALKQEDIALIYKKTNHDERKIIVATNIAEMSITIENIGHVIDTMIEKRAETSHNGGFRLTTHYISKDSAKQRAGRTGRTREGICYRMCTKRKYESLEEHRPPEIQRIPIYEVVVELLAAGLSPEDILEDVDKKKVSDSVKLLKQLGMVVSTGSSVVVTDIGKFAPKFPLSVRNSSFLWNWFNFSGLKLNSNTIREAREVLGFDLSHFEVEDSSGVLPITPQEILQLEEIFKVEKINPVSIIDATAKIGYHSINFMRLFPGATLYAIEENAKTSKILRRNLENLPFILQSETSLKSVAINVPLEDYFSKPRYADIIFMNPEGEIPVTLINKILSKGMTKLVILQLSSEYDYESLGEHLDQGENIRVYEIQEDELVRQRIVLINNRKKKLSEKASMKTKKSEKVPLTSAAYPLLPGIVVAAIIDCFGPSFFWIPRKSAEQSQIEYAEFRDEYKNKFFGNYIGYNDLETCLNMWHDLSETIEGIKGSDRIIAKWSRDKSMNNKKIKELLTTIKRSVNIASRFGYDVEIGPFTTQGVMAAARPLLLSSYSDLVLVNRGGINYIDNKNGEIYRLDNKESINGLLEDPPAGVIALVAAEISAGSGLLRFISFAVDVQDEVLEQLGFNKGSHKKQKSARKKVSKTTIDEALDLLSGLDLTVKDEKQDLEDKALEDALILLEKINSIDEIQPKQKLKPSGIKVTSNLTQNFDEAALEKAFELLEPVINSDISGLDLLDEIGSELFQEENYNPPLVIEKVKSGKKVFNLIQDGYLEVGTKQRGLAFFSELKKAGYDEVATYAATHGYGQVAVSWCCKKVGLLCSLFLPAFSPRTPMTELAIQMGADVYEVGDEGSKVRNSEISKLVKEFCENKPTCYFIPLGLDDPIYIQYLAIAIREAAQDLNPSVIWLAGGSAVIARALAMAFPGVHLNIVQVGRKIYPDVLEGIEHKIYVAPENFIIDTKTIPPYESLKNYDAKVWQFVSKHGKTGDYIWNVK